MKLALCFGKKGLDHRRIAEKMAKAQVLTDLQTSGVREVPGGAMGYVRTSDRFSRVPMMRESENGSVLMVSGVPIQRDRRLDATLDEVVRADYRRAAELLSGLDGFFLAAFWDNVLGRLLVVTDFLGMQPGHLVHRDGVLLLATEMKAVPASGLVKVEPDPTAWGSFVTLGWIIPGRSGLAGVQRTVEGTVLVYDPSHDTLESSTYWQWPEPDPQMTLSGADTGQLVDLFARDVHAYREHGPQGTVLLSGGFDSRLNLSVLAREGMDPDVLTVQHEGHYLGAEGRYARKAARSLTRGSITTVIPRRDFYSRGDYLRYLLMSEVNSPSLTLFIPMVAAAISPEREAIWEGIAPAYTLKNPASICPRPAGFDDYLRRKDVDRRSSAWQAAARVFSPALTETMYESFDEEVTRARRAYPDDVYGVFRFHVLSCMSGRIGANPAKVYSNSVLTFTPGISQEFWRAALRIPYELKADKRLILEIFRRHFPQSLSTAFCSEKGLISARKISPAVWLANSLGTLQYYFDRAHTRPSLGKVLRRLRRAPARQPMRGAVSRILATVNPDASELNADGVRRILGADPGGDPLSRRSRELLFYWQAWRMIMAGELTVANLSTFVEPQ